MTRHHDTDDTSDSDWSKYVPKLALDTWALILALILLTAIAVTVLIYG